MGGEFTRAAVLQVWYKCMLLIVFVCIRLPVWPYRWLMQLQSIVTTPHYKLNFDYAIYSCYDRALIPCILCRIKEAVMQRSNVPLGWCYRKACRPSCRRSSRRWRRLWRPQARTWTFFSKPRDTKWWSSRLLVVRCLSAQSAKSHANTPAPPTRLAISSNQMPLFTAIYDFPPGEVKTNPIPLRADQNYLLCSVTPFILWFGRSQD